jgi:hypothetical protein
VKSGTLGVGGLDVTGNAGLTGRITITNGAPTIYFRDSDNARSSFIHQNSDVFYILSDRNNDGAWDTDGAWPVQITIGGTAGNDLISFSNRIRVEGPASEVRANRICNYNASSCFDPANVGGSFPASQRWYNVTGSRSRNAWYQNATPNAISVHVRLNNGSGSRLRANTSPSWSGSVEIAGPDMTSGSHDNLYGIIPPGGWYMVDSSESVQNWAELR